MKVSEEKKLRYLQNKEKPIKKYCVFIVYPEIAIKGEINFRVSCQQTIQIEVSREH